MAVLGQRKVRSSGNEYAKDPIYGLAKEFRNVAKGILTESTNDIFSEPLKVFTLEQSNEAIKDFFMQESMTEKELMSPMAIEEHQEEMEALYLNDRDVVMEYASMNSFNPVIGMGFPLHKNILMNCIFDKGAIQKAVAACSKFTFDMEYRYLIGIDGEEIDLYKDQRMIKPTLDKVNPFKVVEVNLPESGFTDILAEMGASSLDNLSIDTYISGVKVQATFKTGEILPSTGLPADDETTEDIWLDTRIEFTPGYGENDRITMTDVELPENAYATIRVGSTDHVITKDTVSATMKKNRFTINSMSGLIKAVRISCKKDTSNAMIKTVSAKWKVKTELVEIGPATPINVTISPEEIKDIGALYNVNQLTKVMSIIKDVMENHKDDTIKYELDMSYDTLPDDQKVYGQFDFAARDGYALDHVTWRQSTFLDALDTYVTDLCEVLNDPNVTITIFGRPDLIRKIQPTNYEFKSPSAVGPIELEFAKTIVTTDKRVYQFISSQKLKGSDQLIIVLNPRNTDRCIYRIYDYQMCVTNDIRNFENPTLPSVHTFDRWKFKAYQPVQGRVDILNPTGLKA